MPVLWQEFLGGGKRSQARQGNPPGNQGPSVRVSPVQRLVCSSQILPPAHEKAQHIPKNASLRFHLICKTTSRLFITEMNHHSTSKKRTITYFRCKECGPSPHGKWSNTMPVLWQEFLGGGKRSQACQGNPPGNPGPSVSVSLVQRLFCNSKILPRAPVQTTPDFP